MTKDEFYEKWKRGANPQMIFYNKEAMFNDLNEVICEAVIGWKKFVKSECERTINIDKWTEQEAAAIEKRKHPA